MNALKDRIRLRMQENKISAHALEKRAGLKSSAVHNILYGRSKNPSISTIQMIAETLNCTVDELLEENPPSYFDNRPGTYSSSLNEETNSLWQSTIYLECLELVSNLLKSSKRQLGKENILDIVDEVYAYSTRSGGKSVDRHFAEWMVHKNMK